ncbi:MAG: DUF2059 domain-containing protein [Treponema sp.]|jgi:hypothetical protein|nr:DUF2059 domain-containing protein [Treponema sp.]
MKKLLVLCLLGAGLALSAYGQTKKQDIIRLLEISDTKSQASQMFDLMLPSLKDLAPQAPDAFWTVFKSKMNIDSFVELFVPIYDKYFSHDDIKGLIQFYESPLGKKMLETTPLLTQESYGIGQEWGQKIGQDVVNELVKAGYF